MYNSSLWTVTLSLYSQASIDEEIQYGTSREIWQQINKTMEYINSDNALKAMKECFDIISGKECVFIAGGLLTSYTAHGLANFIPCILAGDQRVSRQQAYLIRSQFEAKDEALDM